MNGGTVFFVRIFTGKAFDDAFPYFMRACDSREGGFSGRKRKKVKKIFSLTKVYIMVYTSDGKEGDDHDSCEGF